MKFKSRKIIALFALVSAIVVLWLEQDALMRGFGDAWFWGIVAGLIIVLAMLELAGVGQKGAPK